MRLLETMRAERGEIALLDRHLARLAASARALGFRYRRTAVLDALDEATGISDERVRLTMGRDGDLDITVAPLLHNPMRTAWVDPEALEEAGQLVCTVKSTDRVHYARRYDRARARGADEAILVNARGDVTEGTRTNVWAEIDGRLWTPPLAAGGLGGVYRAYVLDTEPRAGERTLTPDDLRTATSIFLSNAVRGWMPVEIIERPNAPVS